MINTEVVRDIIGQDIGQDNNYEKTYYPNHAGNKYPAQRFFPVLPHSAAPKMLYRICPGRYIDYCRSAQTVTKICNQYGESSCRWFLTRFTGFTCCDSITIPILQESGSLMYRSDPVRIPCKRDSYPDILNWSVYINLPVAYCQVKGQTYYRRIDCGTIASGNHRAQAVRSGLETGAALWFRRVFRERGWKTKKKGVKIG